MRTGSNPMQSLLGDSRIEIALAAGDRAYGANQVIHSDILEDVSMGPILDGGYDRGIFGVTGEDENPKFRCHGQKPSTGVGDRGVGKLDVE